MRDGTFNTSWWARQMGFKQPEPSLRQPVQPVVVLGDHSGLTPQYQAPTYFGGGTIAAVVGEFGVIVINSMAPGGSIFRLMTLTIAGNELQMGMRIPVAGLASVEDRGPLSVDASVVIVEDGTLAVNPLGAGYPVVRGQGFLTDRGLYLPTGSHFVMASDTVNVALTYSVVVQDVPASEPEA